MPEPNGPPIEVKGTIIKTGECRNGEPRFYFRVPGSVVKLTPALQALAKKRARIEFLEIGLVLETRVLLYRYQAGVVKLVVYIPCALSPIVKRYHNGVGVEVTARIWPY